MIIGSHTIIQSKDSDRDRAFLRDVLGLDGIDSGGGWLIFALPPSELAVHPSSKNDVHEHYLICDDVERLVAELAKRDVVCSPIHDQDWGRLTQVTLPGGGKLGIYQALHARPSAPSGQGSSARGKPAKKAQPAKPTKKGQLAKKASPAKPAKKAQLAKKASPAKPTKHAKASKAVNKPGKKATRRR